MSESIREIDGAELNQLLEQGGSALLECFADGCAPCRQMEETLSEVHKKLSTPVIKINVEENPKVARRYRVQSVPTLLIIKQGEVIDKKVGLLDVDELVAVDRDH